MPAAPYQSDYARVAAAIRYLSEQRAAQPGLEQLARHLGLSQHHLQRLFQRWAGVSPKRFLQHLTLEQAKPALRERQGVLQAALAAGLSGPSRLHDHFVVLESVTPGEYKARGQGLTLRWGLCDSPFGRALLALSDRGINWLAFADEDPPGRALGELRAEWPRARLLRDDPAAAAAARAAFVARPDPGTPLRLLVRGTAFQLQVWRALLRLPAGATTSYGELAGALGSPRAARAVGAAVGANPVSWVIPCHRVLRQGGALGGYRWGLARKQAMLAWESARREAAEA